MPLGTTLLQSPGCNEGKARNATLGKHRQEWIELRRSGTFGASICRGVVPPLQGSLRIGLIPHLPFAVLIIVRYRCLRLLSDLLVGAGVSAVGTTLLQSPGWNEGKARNETLGKHGHKNKSSVGAALSA